MNNEESLLNPCKMENGKCICPNCHIEMTNIVDGEAVCDECVLVYRCLFY